MRGFTPDFDLISVVDLPSALSLLADRPGVFRAFAGGTDLMVQFESGRLKHKNFLDLSRIAELHGIDEFDQQISIQSLATYADIQDSPLIQKHFPILARAAQLTGARAIQNRGTIGGNIANASPAADSSPALLVYDAQIEVQSRNGKRTIPYQKFHLGYKQLDLQADELITSIRLKKNPQWTHQYYRKVGTRAYQSISKVAFAAVVQMHNRRIEDVRIGLGSVADRPIRFESLENLIKGQDVEQLSEKQICQAIEQAVFPIDDIRSTGNYRLKVLQNLTVDFLRKLVDARSPQIYLEC